MNENQKTVIPRPLDDFVIHLMTPEQIENWRRVLCGMFGPYALIMPIEDIYKMRDKFQGHINKLEG